VFQVKVTIKQPNTEEEKYIRTLQKGDFFGEKALQGWVAVVSFFRNNNICNLSGVKGSVFSMCWNEGRMLLSCRNKATLICLFFLDCWQRWSAHSQHHCWRAWGCDMSCDWPWDIQPANLKPRRDPNTVQGRGCREEEVSGAELGYVSVLCDCDKPLIFHCSVLCFIQG